MRHERFYKNFEVSQGQVPLKRVKRDDFYLRAPVPVQCSVVERFISDGTSPKDTTLATGITRHSRLSTGETKLG